MKIDLTHWRELISHVQELYDGIYAKETTEPCYLAEVGSYDREFIDFREKSVVFYNGRKQKAINEKLKGILSFMDERRDFEVYLAGNRSLKYKEKNVRTTERKYFAYMLAYLEEKLEQREEIINKAGVKTLEAYNDAPNRFLPYIVIVIDRAEMVENIEHSPLSLLIRLLFDHADHGLRVITGSTKALLSSTAGRKLQGTLRLDEANEGWLQFYLDHSFEQVLADRPANTISSDPIFNEAVKYMREEKRISTAMLQRKFHIPWSKAMEIVKEMERMGMVGAPNHGERQMLVPERIKQSLDILPIKRKYPRKRPIKRK